MRARLPIVGKLALGRLQDAGIDQPALFQRLEGIVDGAGLDQRALRGEPVEFDADRRQVAADQRHHLGDGVFAQRREPFRFRLAEPLASVALGQGAAGLDQVFAGIEPLRHRIDGLAQRLAVAQMERAREHVDLGAGVVDVILAVHREAGLGEERGQRVADHRAPPVPDMHRPRRVGRDEFDIDPLAGADRRIAVGRAGVEDRAQLRVPHLRIEPDVEKARLGDRHRITAAAVIGAEELAAGQRRADLLGQFQRVLLDRAGQHHRRVGRQIAMRRVARRLDRDAAEIEARRQAARRREIVQRSNNQTAKIAENVAHRMSSYRGVGIEQPAMLVEGESVGHAGEVIGDDPRPLRLAAGPGRRAPLAGQAFGLGEEQLEQLAHDPARLLNSYG